MAVTATLITSGTTNEAHGTGSATSASITPASGNYLAVFVGLQPNGLVDVAANATVAGGSLTWTPRATQALPGTGSGTQCRWFTSTAAGGGSFQLTFDCGSDDLYWIKWFVYEVSGGDVSAPVGATATGALGDGTANSVDGADSITLSAAPASTSVVVAAICVDSDTNASNGASPDTGWTEDGQIVSGSGSGFVGYAQAMQRGGSTSTAVSWADTKTQTSSPPQTYGAAQAAIELVELAGGESEAVNPVDNVGITDSASPVLSSNITIRYAHEIRID